WVFKDSFLPARMRWSDGGVQWDIRFVDYNSPAGDWFPRVVEVARNGEREARFTTLSGDPRANLPDRLFRARPGRGDRCSADRRAGASAARLGRRGPSGAGSVHLSRSAGAPGSAAARAAAPGAVRPRASPGLLPRPGGGTSRGGRGAEARLGGAGGDAGAPRGRSRSGGVRRRTLPEPAR